MCVAELKSQQAGTENLSKAIGIMGTLWTWAPLRFESGLALTPVLAATLLFFQLEDRKLTMSQDVKSLWNMLK
jgi:hypothetical protein